VSPRSYGNTSGAFVSRWVVDSKTLRVLSGRDQITTLVTSGSLNIDRLCSADLAPVSAWYNAASGLGYNGRLFTNGEEAAPNGRAFAHVVDTGVSYELPALGKAGWENLAGNPAPGDRTVVVGQSDGGTQNVYVYAGSKQAAGSPIERAGLTHGVRKVVSVTGLPTENGAVAFPDTPQPFTLADTGTAFDRPEDGAWDPSNPNDYYFVTTASMTKHSRLWKLCTRHRWCATVERPGAARRRGRRAGRIRPAGHRPARASSGRSGTPARTPHPHCHRRPHPGSRVARRR
jgi:hypothetical protein